MNKKIGIVVLAAGKSSRLGRKKQTLPWKNTTLLENTIVVMQQCSHTSIVVVIPPDDSEINKIVQKYNVFSINNPNAKQGVSTSICLGIEYTIKKVPDVDAILFTVCDQPYISQQIIQRIIQAYQPSKKSIIASKYADIVGIPVLFDKVYIPDLLKLQGDRGAKKIIHQYKEFLVQIDFIAGEIDIDTLEDYQNLLGHA